MPHSNDTLNVGCPFVESTRSCEKLADNACGNHSLEREALREQSLQSSQFLFCRNDMFPNFVGAVFF